VHVIQNEEDEVEMPFYHSRTGFSLRSCDNGERTVPIKHVSTYERAAVMRNE
jgi:hypothetical protein